MVRIVAIRAMIALTGSLLQIPVAGHAAVTAILIVAILWAVALSAKLHALREFQRLAVRALECVVVAWIVATQAALSTMRVFHALVKFIKRRSVGGIEIRIARVVACRAGNHHRISLRVFFSRIDPRLGI